MKNKSLYSLGFFLVFPIMSMQHPNKSELNSNQNPNINEDLKPWGIYKKNSFTNFMAALYERQKEVADVLMNALPEHKRKEARGHYERHFGHYQPLPVTPHYSKKKLTLLEFFYGAVGEKNHPEIAACLIPLFPEKDRARVIKIFEDEFGVGSYQKEIPMPSYKKDLEFSLLEELFTTARNQKDPSIAARLTAAFPQRERTYRILQFEKTFGKHFYKKYAPLIVQKSPIQEKSQQKPPLPPLPLQKTVSIPSELMSERIQKELESLAATPSLPSEPVIHTASLYKTLTINDGYFSSIAITPDGQTLVSGDVPIRLWDLKTASLRQTLEGDPEGIPLLAITPDGQTIISGSFDNTIKLWDLKNGSLRQTLRDLGWSITTLAITPNGKTIVSGGNKLKIWDISTGCLCQTLYAHDPQSYDYCVYAVAITPDGKTLVSGSSDHTIKIWDLQSGSLKRTLEGHNGCVNALAITSDGHTIVSGSEDTTIKLWDLNTGFLRQTLHGHEDGINTLAISPDNKTIVSGSGDNTIKLWDLQTLSLHQTLITEGQVQGIAITPNGHTLASSSWDGAIKLWNFSPILH